MKVWTIAKREFKNYFVSPVAYIVIGVFLVVVGWFFFSTFFIYNQASLRKLFDLFPYVLAFIIPAITMRLFAEEKAQGTIETLKTLPFNDFEIVFGKFLGAFFFSIVMLLPTLSYVIFVSRIGDLDGGAVFGGYLGSILLVTSFIAIGIFASSITKNQVVSFIIATLISNFLVLLKAFLVVLPESLVTFFRVLSVSYHFDNFAKGIVDSRDIVYFLSLVVIFIVATIEVLREKDVKKEKKILASSTARIALYLVLLIVLNIAENASSTFRFDLTQNKIYSLSKVSKDSVKQLVEPMTVKVFFSKNLPAPYNGIEQYLKDLLEEYSIYGGDKFNYQFYDLSSKEGEVTEKLKQNEELAQNYGISPVQIQVVEHDEVKFQKAYMGLVIICGDLVEKIPAITSPNGIEYRITSKIVKINNKINRFLSLKGNIKVTLYLSKSLERIGKYMGLGDLAGLESTVDSLVGELNKQNYGKLEFETVDPLKVKVDEKLIKNGRVLDLRWKPFMSPEGKVEGGEGFIGLTVQYQNEIEGVPVIKVVNIPIIGPQYKLANKDELKNSLTAAIDSVLNLNEKIGYVVSNGAVSPYGFGQNEGDVASNFFNLLGENYKVVTLNLKDDNLNEVNALIVPGIKEKLSDYELYKLDQFIMSGKPVLFLVDNFAEQKARNMMGVPQLKAIDTGLDKLLLHYGIDVRKSIVMDKNCFKQKLPQALGGGEQKIYYAPVIKNENINHKLPYLENLKGFIVLLNSPVLPEKGKLSKDTKAEILFKSSKDSWIQSGFIALNPMFIQPPAKASDFKQQPLAVQLTGKLTSFFKGKPIPEKPDEGKEKVKKKEKQKSIVKNIESENAKLDSTDNAKMIVFGTSAIIKNNFIDRDGMGPNSMLMLNSLDYLTGRIEFAKMRSKAQFYNPLKETTPSQRAFIKWFNIAGLAILVAIFGLIVWFLRRKKMEKIKEIFA
ncbi:antibiotic transport system permease protein [Thermotomaculum hydrothermale]|uniref:Antibiotic transport system permease protein n=1 Tax=Thermotomaculum hydrothermale TaxID=981385 RepID=A0A7R6PKG5_9BACT|nr:Gldg family protein [Thermotomaculum hydrothermale]BBB31807.1 antibiotic transport system permease protein [Thermotomaculum hydrothermale]